MSNATVPKINSLHGKVDKSVAAHCGEEKSWLHIHHDEDILPNYFDKGRSLDEFDDVEFDDIQFQYDFRLHRESIQALSEVGSALQSFLPMITYHRHVWWNYGYRLTLEKDECLSLLLRNLGPTAHPEKEIPRGAIGNNSPRNQKPPPASNVHVTLSVKRNGILKAITRKELLKSPLGIGYICSNLINQSALQELAVNNEFIILRISMNINKNYFNIEELISETPSIELMREPGNNELLELVLANGQSLDSDFVFTRGKQALLCEMRNDTYRSGASNDATSYHVHKRILKQRSFVLDGILREKCSLPTDQLLVIDNEDRIIFPYLTDDDMKFLLTYLYTGEIILPNYNGFARVGRVLSLLIDREQLVRIFMEWQKLIVKNLLQFEKSKDENVIVEESFKALISVFSAPYGALPHAKRVAISLLADQLEKVISVKLGGKMNSFDGRSESKLVQFPNGKVVGARWMVRRILGTGAYGAVYEVQSIKDPLISGALKAESNSAADSILKLEVEVLKQLQHRKYTVRLLYSGKRETYSYMVMTLCGPDLITLKHMKNLTTFSESTTLRIAILSLYAIKQLHEIGFVHRDIKPSNIAISPSAADRHIMYLLDYGMVRKYAIYSNKRWLIRQPRKRVLLRGTLRYCSVNTHKRHEQGRVDDLWSLMYMLIDLRSNHLPWGKATREDRILYLKESVSDKELLSKGNMEFYEKILEHLRKLRYADRPDYLHMYKLMVSPMIGKQYQFNEPYDWEVASESETQEESSSLKKSYTSSSKSASPTNEFHFTAANVVIPEDIPLAQEIAFDEGENDVPDILKTAYHVCHRRQDRDRRVPQEESNIPNEDLP
uniref:Protein kinase domain-containing protein n=1 Tax=Setaria digitata TaxID=48799 RepID=A0A915PPB2_9BILA